MNTTYYFEQVKLFFTSHSETLLIIGVIVIMVTLVIAIGVAIWETILYFKLKTEVEILEIKNQYVDRILKEKQEKEEIVFWLGLSRMLLIIKENTYRKKIKSTIP